MKVTEFLEQQQVRYELREHRASFTGQQLAAEEHEPGRFVAKPVIVRADGRFYMCVLPAPLKVDLEALKKQLGASEATLADEREMARLFADCAVGAEPPFGNLYGVETLMDKSLEKDDHLVFQSGTHETAVRMSMADYRRLARPRVLAFSYA
jgi:Ala-tRNA(Pro) deacylase